MSALPHKADINSRDCHVRFVPIGDINCRDCDVRSLAEPEPNRQGLVKFKHLLRKAAARSAKTICVISGEILRAMYARRCANYFRNSRYAQSQKHHALVFVRLAHDRRFVSAVLFVLFLFVLVLFVFIRISGRHRVAHDHEGTPVDQPGGKFLGHVWGHVVAPRVWTLRGFTPTMAAAIIAPMFWPNPPAIAANPVGNSIRSRPLKTASKPRTVTSTGHPFVQ